MLVSKMQLFFLKNQKKFPKGVDNIGGACYNKSVLKETMKGGLLMNGNELRAELARNNLSIPKAADAIGIGKKAFYSKIDGETQFKQDEIKRLKKLLNLSDERVSAIFFAD